MRGEKDSTQINHETTHKGSGEMYFRKLCSRVVYILFVGSFPLASSSFEGSYNFMKKSRTRTGAHYKAYKKENTTTKSRTLPRGLSGGKIIYVYRYIYLIVFVYICYCVYIYIYIYLFIYFYFVWPYDLSGDLPRYSRQA